MQNGHELVMRGNKIVWNLHDPVVNEHIVIGLWSVYMHVFFFFSYNSLMSHGIF